MDDCITLNQYNQGKLNNTQNQIYLNLFRLISINRILVIARAVPSGRGGGGNTTLYMATR